MQSFFAKTFGALSGPVYLRHFLFGAVIAALLITVSLSGKHAANYGFIAFAVINTVLYPYARFVYESVVSYIVGNNQFYFNAVTFVIAKYLTIVICWAFAIFVAPIGLIYLFVRNSKRPTM
ncbi:hypothetical protein [Pseudomonas bohemica]|uniref:hypothetical protein n=1 Tax=Pseudomonas bohemica TaxID=2044872 RepID=UPI000DA62D1E|nr:hypothetical protein [Pseudomonas bohemica]